MTSDRARRLVAEAIGTMLLLAAVVGSGIMADRLSGGNQAIALLANTIATGAALLFRWLVPTLPHMADRIVVPHESPTVERAGRK